MTVQEISYQDGNDICIGRLVMAAKGNPTVLIAPDWSGINSLAIDTALRLQAANYNAFVMDIYGNGKRGQTVDEKSSLMAPFIADRQLLRRRLKAAVNAAAAIEGISSHKIAGLGFCFGGLCVLDMARHNLGLKGVVSFHGLLSAGDQKAATIATKILVLHGHDDPLVPPSEVLKFQEDMTKDHADWQMHTFGQTSHAFANPEANDKSGGMFFQEHSASRGWSHAWRFLDELFSE